MKYLPLLLFIFLNYMPGHAQLDCTETFTMKVTANSGLNMRTQANAASEVLTTIPLNSILIACASTSGRLVVGNTSGFWRQVSFEGKKGYVFDAYLELVDPELRKTLAEKTEKPKPEPKEKTQKNTAVKHEDNKAAGRDMQTGKTEAASEKKVEAVKVVKPLEEYDILLEAYNFCGAVENIDPGILWYGFYPADPDKGETDMKVKPVELEIVLSKSRSGKNLEFDIRTDRDERSLFMIGSKRPLPIDKMDLEDRSELMRYSNQKVFPGQQINISGNGQRSSLSATGGISSTGDCPELDNYKLVVEAGKRMDLMELLPKGQCGLPEIYWFGDLNGDQLPDFIVVSIFKDRNLFSLIVSGEDPFMRKAAEWSIEKCKD